MDNYYYYPFSQPHPVTSGFRPPGRPFHVGVDFGWNADEGPHFLVLASAAGVVTRDEYENPGGGHWLQIGHGSRESTTYMHLSEKYVHLGDEVFAGQPIGMSGESGGVAPHLHFELRESNQPLDPLPYLQWPETPPEPAPLPPIPKGFSEVLTSCVGADGTVYVFCVSGDDHVWVCSKPPGQDWDDGFRQLNGTVRK